ARHARTIMYYFPPEKLPVLTTLARNFAVFNGWFSSVPGPGRCNHSFAHYGSSFGGVGNQIGPQRIYQSIFERLWNFKRTAKLYVEGRIDSTRFAEDLPPSVRSTYPQFLADCQTGSLPDYSFIEPNHSDHLDESGKAVLANDQHPDHNVQAGEFFIASVYNALI